MSAVTDAELKEITDTPILYQLLPYTFQNGSRLDEIVVSCSVCNGEIPNEHIHGTLTEIGKGVVLRAYLLCYECQIISPFEARIRDDGTMIIKTDNGWKESRYAPENQGSGADLVGLISKLADKISHYIGR